ncbi:G-type lectin S-receptor-like serine/threonine-protein kinase At1g34300 [Selaginella moellendorffii]|uniref:G-type lectin S-receptor-like serine/threonine-protein kinase At1g34300 n=1 Tax=Selaginella moellendorffii TaxID=88036 RepID=UPI000D1CC567|nr:G-type lectin S-receptor-like serine/threonine-protein kinase At1g34300 [Selaginella moellendorffii]|eukprot:XP_024532358.1 G-type lectin S-receptor-like serine/threonine-protein kinase At1g34300 [Selaginella moellendorffii]
MQDDGNLVLKHSNNSVLWQSFDLPTDTLLQDQVFKGRQALISGRYSLQMTDVSAQLIFLAAPELKNLTSYWTIPQNLPSSSTGSNNSTSQSSRLVMNSSGIVTFTDASNVSNYQYSLDFTFANTRVMRMLKLEPSGNLRIYSLSTDNSSWNIVWQAMLLECQIHGVCGPFGLCTYAPRSTCVCPPGFHFIDPQDHHQGCTYDVPLQLSCNGSSNHHDWVRVDRASYDGNDYVKDLSPTSLEGCRRRCDRDCGCLGFVYRVDRHGTCYTKGSAPGVIYNGFQIPSDEMAPSLVFLKVSTASSFQPEAPLNQLFSTIVNATNVKSYAELKQVREAFKLVIPAAIAAAELLLFLAAGVIWWLYTEKRIKRLSQALDQVDGVVTKFTYHQLELATGNFKDKLGAGAFGTVYKGVLADGTSLVAVKSLMMATHAEKQFKAEVATLGKIHHINLVRMLGYCAEGSHRLLVYEYMANSSLEKVLFAAQADQDGKNNETPGLQADEASSQVPQTLCEWKTRLAIALGISRGITYLHEQCQECIIHCDIKPQNILLDDNFRPKVSDFGLAKLMKRESSANVTTARGTRGYMAPEWISNVAITPKVDVYSFGMVLLELMSGRDKFMFTPSAMNSGRWYFPVWAFEQCATGNMKSTADPRMAETIDWEQFEMALRVAFWCIQPEPESRPSMSRVVQMLEENAPVPAPPLPRIFEDGGSGVSRELSVMYPSESGR